MSVLAELRARPVTLGVCTALVAAYAALSGPMSESPGWWESLAGVAAHGDALHLLVNVGGLALAGWRAEPVLGATRFAALLLAAALFGTALEYALAGPGFIGASAMTIAALAYAVLGPTRGRERWLWTALGALALAADGLLNPAPLAQFAHAGGFAVGLAAVWLWPWQGRANGAHTP